MNYGILKMNKLNSLKKKERDPLGLSVNEPGAKLDYGKLRPFLVYRDFIHALEEVFKDGTYGAAKYSDSGWLSVPNARERYLDAALRHLNKFIKGETMDDESEVHHLGAVAWNILAVLELELRQSNKDK